MGENHSRESLIAMLASALGQAKATDLIDTAARKLALSSEPYDHNQAITLLTEIGEAPGLVGVTASLASSRLYFSRSLTRMAS